MSDLLVRLVILAAASLAVWLAVAAGRRIVEGHRRQALAAVPAPDSGSGSSVRILAFSSDDCVQCHRMQAPALHRVLEARPAIVVDEIDAPTSPELTRRYSVLTVPSTVVLDASGRARAVNYGFANAQRLIAQVDEALAGTSEAAPPAERVG
jgi:hypothetical protein